MSFLPGRDRRSRRGFALTCPESLEVRALLAAVAVDVGQVIRAVDPQLVGVNATWWDTNLNTPQTQQMVEAAGLNLFRLPGGSSSDDFHFNAAPTYQGEGTIPSMASFVASVNGQAVVTLDYGSGSPQEAAAELAYLNAPVGATTPIGVGPEWSDSAGQWQMVNWQNAGYWASLRAATPVPGDPDGLNFMRLGRTAPFGFHYFEVGNEEYGSWEIDNHTVPHDPATYVAFATQFQTFAAAIDPTISIGIDAGSPDNSYNNWVPDVLQQSVMQGFTIGFISDHNYVQAPGSESDSTLLLDTVSDPSSPFDWAVRATGYTDLLNQYLGSAAAANVELLTTEFNSVYTDPGKQSTSLVNGLFIADSIGALLETPYDGAIVWALRNGSYNTANNDSPSLYGWREGGDYGLLGTPPVDPPVDSPPANGTYVPYPSYFGEQLASNIVQAGGSVVQASSDDPDLAVYAVHEANGDLDLLVINKSPSGPITGQFAVTDFQPAAQAQVLQYGEAQDTAQSESSTGQSALASFSTALSLSGSSFSYAFPAYSMSVVELSPGASGPTITSPAAATPSPVTGTSTALSVSATDAAGAGSLTYMWSTISSPLTAVVMFSVNGTNAAQDTTATFSKAGTYEFQVFATDPSGLSTNSEVTVTVDQTLTSIKVSPSTATVAAGGTQPFTAQGDDQFGNPMSPQPVFGWSMASGIGSVNPVTGVYLAPGAGGSAVVEASSGSVQGTASITVTPPSGPTITQSAAAAPNPVTGTTTDLSVSATDPAGAGSVTYMWSTISSPLAAVVMFSVNGTNAAQDTTATFSLAGTYTFEVVASDPSSRTANSKVTVTVDQTLTSIKVSPSTVTVAAGKTQLFTAQADDQFGNPMSLQPGFGWSMASGIGSVNAVTGIYAAPGTAGTAVVEASSSGVHGTASVNVTPPPGPTITQPAAATPSPVTGTTTALSVSATDPAGAGSLTYTWSPIAPSPAGVIFSVNGTNAAQDTTATFSQAGTYTFKVIASDPSGLTAPSDVTVTVDQTLTSIKVRPPTATVGVGTTQPFTAQAGDQFGNPMSPQPGFAWSLASGIGSVNSTTGVYSAPGAGGAAVVEASSSGVHGTASVTVAPPSATVRYTDSNDWRSGFVGDIMITNAGPGTIDAWTLQFDFAVKITSIWGATIVSHTGNQYVVQNASYNGSIAPGQSVSFGFEGKPGRAQAGPTNWVLNGVSLPAAPQAPTPSATATFTLTAQSTSGFAASITITNMGTVPIGGWALQFNFSPKISSVSNAAIVRHVGASYLIRDAGYDGVIDPGKSVSFQLKGAQRKLRSGPVKYSLDGVAISGNTIL